MTDIVERLEYIGSICEAEGIARAAYDGATEITRLRQLLSEAEKREKEARAKALEEAAKVADRYTFDEHAMSQATGIGHAIHHNAMEIAGNIRALQSEER